ncbi:Hypothetical predicted protein [Scomber scombrus]|uniref:Uncharacterized protein n=1 Tax=Scomber scombrus TaxID=13677 RepID=A0AAV1PA72_SCOSC
MKTPAFGTLKSFKQAQEYVITLEPALVEAAAFVSVWFSFVCLLHMSPRSNPPRPSLRAAAMFRQTERDRDTLTVVERDAENFRLLILTITSPNVCVGGFKGRIRKSQRR